MKHPGLQVKLLLAGLAIVSYLGWVSVTSELFLWSFDTLTLPDTYFAWSLGLGMVPAVLSGISLFVLRPRVGSLVVGIVASVSCLGLAIVWHRYTWTMEEIGSILLPLLASMASVFLSGVVWYRAGAPQASRITNPST
jgi:hypothetical protein